ncbi:golgin subfamily A member 6-like protein 22 isoform X2 [Syngnathoides biaculeatus]|uniref:golgin subfamily A member 6-like protein 22 isoform X2 n=1 Tax=Syngnathoides biaculeatus TaxID=300417 RepID=UPI002ADE002E|nr:golgin subfamily A member 6-like protein 22 isoform X2 [Syngnathoides biaculeatus]
MSVNQRDFAPRSGAEGDAARYKKDSSQTCSLPRLLPSQRPLQTKTYVYKAQEDKLNPYRRSEALKLKLPPIRDTAKLREQSTNNMKELKNQNYVLQQQLKDSKTENKLLKNVLHRHTVALQQFQDLEGSISQDQHRNEVKALRKLLSETRSSRDKLARKLQSTERELLDCKDRINHLQWRVNQNPNLLEKEELTRRLTEFTIHLEEKDRRIQFLEKSNMLLQSSLNRQVATEYKKMFKTNAICLGLQTAVCELSKKTQPDRTREAETDNINIMRLRKHGRKAKQSKMVQTEERVSATSEAGDRVKSDVSETDEKLRRWQSSDNTDYLRRKSHTSEQRRTNNQNYSGTNAVSAYGDIHQRHEERKHLSEDTQESEEESEEEENEEKQGSKDEEEEGGGEKEEGGHENEHREGGERSEENNGEGKEGKEEHNEGDYEEGGMEQNEEEDETEGKEENSEEMRFGEKFEDMTGEYDDDDDDEEEEEEEERDYEEEEDKWEEKEWEEQEEDNEEEEKEDKKVKNMKLEEEKQRAKEHEKQRVEEQEGEEENELEEVRENIDDKGRVEEEAKVEQKERGGTKDSGEKKEEEVDDLEEEEAVLEVVEEVKQQEKRKEKGAQKDARTNKQCSLSCVLNEPKVVTPREPKRCPRPKIRRKYNFTPVTKNLHLGKPAYSGVQLRCYKGANVPVKEETLYCRNRRRSAEMAEDIYLSDEQTSQPDAASDGSDADSKHTDSPSWT